MYVCMYVCMYIYLYVCIWVWTYFQGFARGSCLAHQGFHRAVLNPFDSMVSLNPKP